MAIIAGEIQFRYSGGGNNSDPLLSVGGVRSSVSIVTDTAQNLFDNVTGEESRDGRTEYRCFFVYNTNTADTLVNARIWFHTLTTSPDDEVAMALGDVPVGTSDEQTTTVFVAPTNPALTFETPTIGSPLTIGDIPATQHKGVWLRRTVQAGAGAYTDNRFSWTVEGESG